MRVIRSHWGPSSRVVPAPVEMISVEFFSVEVTTESRGYYVQQRQPLLSNKRPGFFAKPCALDDLLCFETPMAVSTSIAAPAIRHALPNSLAGLLALYRWWRIVGTVSPSKTE